VKILAINPWIYDFAAFDYWLKPYGFLNILAYLQKHQARIDYTDCLEKKVNHDEWGRGKYFSEEIEKPIPYKNVPRHFKRYGMSLEEFKQHLDKETTYDYILLTSSMTYWYPALMDVIKILRAYYPQTKIILGGTYATLCSEHAKDTIGADKVFTNMQLKEFFTDLGIIFDQKEFYNTLPDWDFFYPHAEYVVVKSSWGCPFNCSYCANPYLFKGFLRLDIDKIFDYIEKYSRTLKNFVLYDDAFLYEPDYAKQLLKKISGLNRDLRFHTPNALHWKYLDKELATLLKECGFTMPCFGMETMDDNLQKEWGGKTEREELEGGVKLLHEAGYKNGEYAVYLLLGYPGQDLTRLKSDLEFLNKLGVKVSLAEFSPVPHTSIFEKYSASFQEPLMQNNSIFSCFEPERMQAFWEIKNYAKQLNNTLKKI
jgi:pyruvate-formate lyase-activating enzyme